MIETKFKNSISLQLLKKVFIIYFSITIIITLSQITIEYFETKNDLKAELISLEDTFKESLTDSIWDMNVAQTNSLASSIYNLPFVEEILIKNESDNVIFNKKNAESSSLFSHEFSLLKQYNGSTIIIARVKISSSDCSVIDRVKVGVLLILLNAFVKSLLLTFLFIWAFKTYLTKPLNSFTQQIEDINFDNISTKRISIETEEENELYHLKEKFNQMIEALNTQKDIVENLKSNYVLKLKEQVCERTAALEKSNAELSYMANTDYLTHINNRRSFYEMGENYFKMTKRHSTKLCLLVIDLDHFKGINDTYGHQCGDEVLKHFASTCKSIFRDSDVFGRVGGEEFSAVLYDTDLEDAKKISNRIIEIISNSSVKYLEESINYTVSIGLAEIEMDDRTLDDIVHRADDALYRAKTNGRNQVSI